MIAIAPTKIHFRIHFHSILNYDFYNYDIKYYNFLSLLYYNSIEFIIIYYTMS